jgi:hypothetical protein
VGDSVRVCLESVPCRLGLKCDGTCAETRFGLSVKWTSPFKWRERQFSRLLAAEVCASAVVMLDTPRSELVCRVLAIHSIRQFPLHFPSRASPCAITFQLDCTFVRGTMQYILTCIQSAFVYGKKVQGKGTPMTDREIPGGGVEL